MGGADTAQMTLPELVDLAIGTPEIGVVNYNILHNLLHIMIQQLDLDTILVEFKGNDATRISNLLATGRTGPSLTLTEYKINDKGEREKIVERSSKELKSPRQKKSDQKVDKKPDGEHQHDKKHEEHGKGSGTKVTKDKSKHIESPRSTSTQKTASSKTEKEEHPAKRQRSTLEENEIGTIDPARQSVIVVEQSDTNIGGPTVTVAHERFLKLEQDVANLQKKIYDLTEISADDTLLEAVRNSGDNTPIQDMWRNLNIAKRMEAAEKGIEKLSAIVETVIRDLGFTVEYEDNVPVPGKKIEKKSSGDDDKKSHKSEPRLDKVVQTDKKSSSPKEDHSSQTEQTKADVPQRRPSSEKHPKRESEDSNRSDTRPKSGTTVELGGKDVNKKSSVQFDKEVEITEGGHDPSREPSRETDKEASKGKSRDSGSTDKNSPSRQSQRSSKFSLRASKEGIFGELIQRMEAIEKKVGLGKTGTPSGAGLPKKQPSGGTKTGEKRGSVGSLTEKCLCELENLKNEIKTMKEEVKKIHEKEKKIDNLITEVAQIKNNIPKAGEAGGGGQAEEGQNGDQDQQGEPGSQTSVREIDEKLQALDETFAEKLDDLSNQLQGLERELGELTERVNIQDGQLGQTNIVGINELFDTVQRLQVDVQDLMESSGKMNEETEKRQFVFDAMVEEIELLKTSKADREDLEDALADKADAYHMNRKVSHDQFDAVCDELNKGIEDAYVKLTQQETVWAQALEEIQQSVGNKLDKMEFDPLRDFVNNKITKLQEKLKALIALKKEQEAAGTKSRFLRNINCISCDKDVIMKKFNEYPTIPGSDPMPAKPSMRPFLTYELDQVRKQKKCLPLGKNMKQLESAVQEEKISRKQILKQTAAGDHLCNRYCGGSHTVTTPYQRVTRVGHFLTQWGPEAIPLGEVQVQGKDGAMYKARGDVQVKQAEKPMEPQTSRHSATVQTSLEKVPTRPSSSTVQKKVSPPGAPSPSKEDAGEKPGMSPKASVIKSEGPKAEKKSGHSGEIDQKTSGKDVAGGEAEPTAEKAPSPKGSPKSSPKASRTSQEAMPEESMPEQESVAEEEQVEMVE